MKPRELRNDSLLNRLTVADKHDNTPLSFGTASNSSRPAEAPFKFHITRDEPDEPLTPFCNTAQASYPFSFGARDPHKKDDVAANDEQPRKTNRALTKPNGTKSNR
jgi:hypothetical protein